MVNILVATLILLLAIFFAKEAFQYFYFRLTGAAQPPKILEAVGRIAVSIGALEISLILCVRIARLYF